MMPLRDGRAAVEGLGGLGWREPFASAFEAWHDGGHRPGRVLGAAHERYVVGGADGDTAAVLAGRLRHEAADATDLPAVGDWVVLEAAGGPHDDARIVAVLPRSAAFVRGDRDATRRSGAHAADAQVAAANVDTVAVVAAIDGDPGARRLERSLALAWSSGAEPAIVLNKADLADDVAGRVADVRAVAPGVPLLVTSARTGIGLDALVELVGPGRTLAFLGPSGVGKSTLVNALVGRAVLATGPVRESDRRGRHTTTRRELIRLPGGGLLLDTPGMRALGLWDADDGVVAAFADVASLAERCRFGDCRHESEPGCAVLAAVASGELAAERLASHRKLVREARAAERRTDPRARALERQRWRSIQRSVDVHMRSKYGPGT